MAEHRTELLADETTDRRRAPRAAATVAGSASDGPTIACLVNHFDYARFVGEAIDGALAQERAFDEIVVVDDGSSPEQRAELRGICADRPAVRLIEKANEGQLSCFQLGVESTDADIVFFLDADDWWEPAYTREVLAVFERQPMVDFVVTNEARVHDDGRREFDERADRDLGYSVVRCSRRPVWVGGPTSCLAIRRSILDRIFPFDSTGGWRTCADESLVMGSSVAGARKYLLGTPLVNYRVHGDNAWFGRAGSADRLFERRLERERLCESIRERLHIPHRIEHLAHIEFRTIEEPTRAEYRDYHKLVARAPIHWRTRLRVLSGLFAQYYFGAKV